MKTKLPLLLAILLPLAAHAATDLSTALQKGLFEEEANQNLPAAIQAYQSLLAASDDQRKLAATALFRLGECYRKLGQTNDAVAQYQRLIRDFTDQTTLATLSRQNLVGLGAGPTPSSSLSISSTVVSPISIEAQELARTERILAQLSGLDLGQARRLLPTLVPDADSERYEKLLVDAQERAERATGEEKDRWQKIVAQKTVQLAERFDVIRRTLTERAAQLRIQVAKDSAKVGSATEPAAPIDEEQNEIRRIQAIIKDSPDLINAPGVEVKLMRSSGATFPKNGTLLHKAASLGQLRVATFLLDHGADIGARDQGAPQNTPLHWAAMNGHRAMVELLLSRQADPNAMLIPDGSTPLLLATRTSFRSVCEALLARGANPNLPDSASEVPLDSAASRGDEAIVRLLLDKGAEVNRKSKSGVTSLHRTSSTNIARLLLERGAEVNAQDEQGRSPLFGAAERDQRDLLQLLLAQKADAKLANKSGWTPLHAAADAGAASVITPLIQNGADPNQQDGFKRVPLDFVIQKKSDRRSASQPSFAIYPETLKALLAGGANPNPPGDKVSTVLYRAVAAGDEQMTEMLLKAGANPNVKMDTQVDSPYLGVTPLIGAISTGSQSLSLITLLLEHKADPNLKTDNGFAPVDWALVPGKERILEALLSHGADPDARNGVGKTPLGSAAENSSKEAVALLLKYKADPNAKSHNGQSPLHVAVLKDKRDLVDLLLAANANPNATDEKGLSPLDYVKPKARQDAASAEMGEKLRKAGALDWAPRPNQITITRRGRRMAPGSSGGSAFAGRHRPSRRSASSRVWPGSTGPVTTSNASAGPNHRSWKAAASGRRSRARSRSRPPTGWPYG